MEICLICLQVDDAADGTEPPLRWHDAAEMSHFKDMARDHPVVMGRRTWESLPGGLPGRQNVVLSSHKLAPMGALHCESLSEALTLLSVLKPAKVFLIGGAGLLAKASSIADRLYMARIGEGEADADASAADIDPQQFALAYRFSHKAGDRIQLHVEEYTRQRTWH